MHNSHLIYLFFTNYTISQHLVVLTPPAKTRISSARRLGHRGSSRLLCCSRRDANVVTVLRISDSLFTVLRMSRLCRHNSQGKHHLFFFLDFNRWGCCFFPSLRPGHEKVHFFPPKHSGPNSPHLEPGGGKKKIRPEAAYLGLQF